MTGRSKSFKCSGVGTNLKVGEGATCKLVRNLDKQKKKEKKMFGSGYVQLCKKGGEAVPTPMK